MLSKSTEYAIRAMVYIQLQNWKKQRPGVNEIAKEIEVPMAYTAKILHILTKHKLLNSMKGCGGGFFLNEDKVNLILYDVIHVMEGDGIFNKCGFGLKNCNDLSPCPLHDEYKSLRDGFYDLVNRETIGSLANKILDGKAVLNQTIINKVFNYA